jgi:hypothetical protein
MKSYNTFKAWKAQNICLKATREFHLMEPVINLETKFELFS